MTSETQTALDPLSEAGDGISGSGEDAAPSVLFADLALPDKVLAALTEDGYLEPSPIQAAIIPHLLAGRDVIGQAQTGTGKTAAFALPILAMLAADEAAGVEHPSGPSALVLVPTRELAIQVADAFEKYARKLRHVGVLAVYGGADMRGQSIALHRGVDVVVGTPGRVMDHMRRGSLDVGNVRTLVLDEADEMLRMGFVDDVEWVMTQTPPGRQVALFSATMPSAIQKIAEKQLSNPERVRILGGGKAADTVRQRYWRAQGVGKVEALCRLLAVEPVDAAIVFVRTRAATAELARSLEDAGFPAAPLSGDVPQAQRERTIDALREGRLKLIVATDVAARGIDVRSISHVFNFDVPADTEAYIHRIGRTGRAGRTGEAVLFVENRQRQLLSNIERATGRPIEKMELPTPEDIHALQLQRFGDRFKARLTRKADSDAPAALRGFIEGICAETGRDAIDIAAYLVGPAMNAVLGGAVSPTGAAPRDTASSASRPAPRGGERNGTSSREERAERPAPRAPVGGAAQRYRVAVGNADGVRAGHLVGAIANETGLDGQDIGGIRIFEAHSTVELPADLPADMLQLLRHINVLGKPLRLTREDGPAVKSSPVKPEPRREAPVKHRATPHKPSPKADSPKPATSAPPPPVKKPFVSAKAKPTAAAKPKPTKPKPFTPSTNTKPGKPGKPGKTVGKFKLIAKPGGKPGAKQAEKKFIGKPASPAKPSPAGKPKRNNEGHSLAPAAFPGGVGGSGGRVKPKRPNKRPRPKG